MTDNPIKEEDVVQTDTEAQVPPEEENDSSESTEEVQEKTQETDQEQEENSSESVSDTGKGEGAEDSTDPALDHADQEKEEESKNKEDLSSEASAKEEDDVIPEEVPTEATTAKDNEDSAPEEHVSKIAGVFGLSEEEEEEQLKRMEKGRQPKQGRNWYAIHTYSGYEDSVEKSMRQRIETLNMQEKIFDILVPKETQIVMRRGKPVEVKKCLFPGYVLVDMVVTDDSWYVVRNTPNVTGFVGSGNIPVAVTLEEFGVVQARMGTDEPKFKSDFNMGDIVKIMKGPFATFEGKVDQVDAGKGKLTVLVTVFDRETPVELDFDQVMKK